MERRKLTKEDIDKVRNIEGFPIGTDEDIIALSDAPFYTACPNPFIEDFIKEYGTPYDEATDDYHREPFAADVSEGKADTIYNAHSYHTKVPYKAIMRYILHYTEPGDIVFDGFCGTGMAAVAAQMCGEADSITKAKLNSEMPKIKFGRRKAVISDIAPAATFIAYNYTHPIKWDRFEKEANSLLSSVEKECAWMYKTKHTSPSSGQMVMDTEDKTGVINYIIWSDVFICPHCGNEIVFWNAAVDRNTGRISDDFSCTHCGIKVSKKDCDRAKQIIFDHTLSKTIQVAKQVPVQINYSYCGKRYEKAPDEDDFRLIEKIDSLEQKYWYPKESLPDGDKTSDPRSVGVERIYQFYTPRTLYVLSALVDKISEYDCQNEDTAWAFVRQHLANIPVVVVKNDHIEVVAERQAYLLFDRMVAYHIMQGIPVPLDATDFYRGLDEKFLKRDNMYFLPDQVNEYDTARITTEVENIQFELFVTNEKSAISWLYQQLDSQFCGPQTYAELQPKFMQEVKAVDKYEQMPELAIILEENFLQDEKGRWYIPDVTKEGDLVKLREKNLWKEFEGYMNSKGKLKLFRSEAIRVGFSRLWKEKNYKAIVDIAERLPEQTIQEDANLLMYYDISLGRV